MRRALAAAVLAATPCRIGTGDSSGATHERNFGPFTGLGLDGHVRGTP
jgi:hypothetical protein